MRLLVLTHAFPPSRYPNGKRPAHVVRAALAAGWKVDVVTSRFGTGPRDAETLTHPGLRVFRRADRVERFCRMFSGWERLFRVVSLGVNGTLWPDEHVLWSGYALRKSRTVPPYEVVLASILPASLLLAGLRSDWLGAHWVIDYQEPVTPFLEAFPKRSPWHRFLLPWLRRLERRALRRVGQVVFSSESNRQAYLSRGWVAPERTVHIPYFYDPAEFPGIAPRTGPLFEITYLGTFDWRGARSPEIFLRALAAFLGAVPEARAATRFVFHGPWLPEHTPLITELGLADVVRIGPPVPHQQYLSKLQESGVLLLVAAGAHNLFMPSKLADYLGARRPILAFVPPGSEVARVLGRAGMAEGCCAEADVDAGRLALQRLWRRHREGALVTAPGLADEWSLGAQMPRYLEVIHRAAGLQASAGFSASGTGSTAS